MKPDEAVRLAVVVLVATIVLGVVVHCSGMSGVVQTIANVALIATLGAVIAYVEYTRRIAEQPWLPSAGFALSMQGPSVVRFDLVNHCRLDLECWCRLNASVYGESVTVPGFYAGESSFRLQPYGAGHGHFEIIKDIVMQSKVTGSDLDADKDSANAKRKIRLNVEFWYHGPGGSPVGRNQTMPYYLDWERKVLVSDF